ncbi:alpha/beta hydrolase [Mariniflexile ostreae]|uniref:Alpha/beta hydrolase n=1 Tax=Mariniflexile ostreae TaxID=1520892 RepID=A0ABV5FD18_9FLAO
MKLKNTILFVLTLSVVTTVFGQQKFEPITEDVIYKIIKADTLSLRLYYPDNFKKKTKHATIVFFFGGGWNGGSIDQFEGQSKYFASRGMVSVVVDYRVKNRNQSTPFDAVKDAKTAMRFLRSHAKDFGIHPEKIIAAGGSAGGHLAAATSMLPGINETTDNVSVSPKANALILYNPVIDNGKGGYGYERIGDRYLEFSPIHNITKGAPPTIFFLGDRDKWIPVATAYSFKEKMEAVGSRCDIFIYKNQAHGFFNKGKQEGDKYYIETTREADVFLQSLGYLKGKATL